MKANKSALALAVCVAVLSLGTVAQAKAVKTRTEKVNCSFKTTSDIVLEDGTSYTETSDSKTTVRRTVVELGEGKEKVSTSGETTVVIYKIQGDSKELSDKYAYSYTSLTDKKVSKLGEGYKKTSVKVKTIQTGKDGYQFETANGKSDTRTSEFTNVKIEELKGKESREVSVKHNNTYLPIRDYVTVEEKRQDGVTVTTTTLKTPYTDDYGAKYTVKEDVQVCETVVELRN
ncbi:hypothetical protein ACES2L_01445 [Bdellovibrio bacteriovorus]